MPSLDDHMRLIHTADDVTEHLLALVVDAAEGWPDGEPMPEEDFIDRLCGTYLNRAGVDIEQLDTPATRKIMRCARQVRREML